MQAEVTLERVLEASNLKRAWKAVKANAGAAGVDGRDIESTRSHLKAHWEGIARKLKAGEYRPGAIRAVPIAKANGGTRTLEQVTEEYRTRPDKAANILAPVELQCDWLREIGYQDVDCYMRIYELAVFGGRKPVIARSER